MLLPAMESKEKILKTLKEAKKKLKNNGKIIIGIGHPCFNHYMQKYLFGRNDVRVNFQGYFKSGTKFRVPQKFNGNELIFEDYHRTITDYFSYIRASGFTVLNIDECKPITSEDKTINSYLKKFKQFPIYMVFTCE